LSRVDEVLQGNEIEVSVAILEVVKKTRSRWLLSASTQPVQSA
jgi:hypothetical protein